MYNDFRDTPYLTNSHLRQLHQVRQTPRSKPNATKTRRKKQNGEKKIHIHFFRNSILVGPRVVDLRVTLARGELLLAPDVMVHHLIPITMNLSDVKTQSPPESGLPWAVRATLRPGDHKSRGICDRISYVLRSTGNACNADVKEADWLERASETLYQVVVVVVVVGKLEGENGERRRGKKRSGEGHGPPGFLSVRRGRDG